MNGLLTLILFLLTLLSTVMAAPPAWHMPRATPQGEPLPSLPGEDLTCGNFATQAEAQLVLDADPQDPFGLDVDLDGVACETPLVARSAVGSVGDDDRRARRAVRTGARTSATPPSLPAEDVDCIDFDFQEDAQAIYDQTPGDPYNLDPSGDGFACSSLPSRGGG